MAISYPAALPTHTGIAQIELRAINAVAYSASPFTFAGQAHAYPGQMWTADITLPPMNRSTAETWIAFLLSLRGQFGTFLLKSFFSESLTTESGEEVSSREVKKILSDAIEGEDKRKPLADEKLAELLKEKGYTIARRTVAKYREQLGIPVARLRKEL